MTGFVSVVSFGAVGDGVADDTAAIQDAIDSLVGNQSLYFPATPNAFYKVTDTLYLPNLNAITMFGDGKLASRIRLVSSVTAKDLFRRIDEDPSEPNNFNYWQIRGLGLEGSGLTRHALNWLSLSRSSIEDVWVNGFGGAALFATSSLYVKVTNCIFMQNGYGILQTAAGWTGLNGWSIEAYIGGSTSYGIYIGEAAAGVDMRVTVESCALGGIYLRQNCEGIVISGYFEENKSALTSTQDIYIGATTLCHSIKVQGCYFNGDDDSDDYYYPIRMGYAYGCSIDTNLLAVGAKFVKLETANNIHNSFGQLEYDNDGFRPSNDYQPTYNFGSNALSGFVNAGNAITDRSVPLIESNLAPERLPFGGWTTTATGAASVIRSGSDIYGMPAEFARRPSGSLSRTRLVAVQAHVRGQLVVFSLPVTSLADGSEIEVSVSANGTAPLAGSITEMIANTSARLIQVTAFVPVDATTITLEYTLTQDGSQFIVGQPCLAVGAQPWYSAEGERAWRHTAAPTDGSWAQGDIVWNSAPGAGGAPGWMNVSGGSPGTFKQLANLAS